MVQKNKKKRAEMGQARKWSPPNSGETKRRKIPERRKGTEPDSMGARRVFGQGLYGFEKTAH